MQNAIHFIKGYLIPAYKFTLGDTGGLTVNTMNHRVMEYVLEHAEKVEMTVHDVKMGLRRYTEDIPLMQRNLLVHDAMAMLQDMGWVTCLNDHYTKGSWLINDKVKTIFKDRRISLIRARQRLKDIFAEYAEKELGREIKRGRNAKYAYLLEEEDKNQ